MNAVLHVAVADCRERLRRFSIVAVSALSAFLGYQIIAGTLMIRLGRYRGVMNAAWIGILMATAGSFFLSLLGFYVTRGNVTVDRESGIGQILAATPLRASSYVIGKFLSNCVVLTIVIAVLFAAAAVMHVIHGEQGPFSLTELLLPFLVFTLPVAIGVAATAVLFECLPILRSPAGNVVFFFVWLVVLPVFGGAILGFDEIERSMGQAITAQGGDYQGGVAFGMVLTEEMRTFVWTGFDWSRVTPARALGLAGLLPVLLSIAVLFHRRERFDPERTSLRRSSRMGTGTHTRAVRLPNTSGSPDSPDTSTAAQELQTVEAPAVRTDNWLSGFLTLVAGEFRLLAKGRRTAWYLVACGLIAASLVAPVETTRRVILPLAWIWPILIWSEMGVRETQYRVDSILGSCPSPVFRQTAATWTAALLFSIAAGVGALVRFVAAPELLAGFFAGAAFIVSLALFLGVIGRTERVFHITMIALWYFGPVNGVAALDYTGATDEALAMGMPWVYAGFAALLLAATFVTRAFRSRA